MVLIVTFAMEVVSIAVVFANGSSGAEGNKFLFSPPWKRIAYGGSS